MAASEQIPLRRVIAGLADGVWMAVVVGAVLMLVAVVGREIGMRFFQAQVAALWGIPVQDLPGRIFLAFMFFKAMLSFFFLVAVALSCWWRVLPQPGADE